MGVLVQAIPPVNEWQECRNTIGRLDGTIVDLRKYGFTIVTALITANGFLGHQNPNSQLAAAVSVAIMVFIVALSTIDRFYVIIQSAAVERALDMEGPEIPSALVEYQLTQMISRHALETHIVYLVPALYILLLLATLALAWGMVDALRPVVLVTFVFSALAIWVYYRVTEDKAKTGSWREDRVTSKSRQAGP